MVNHEIANIANARDSIVSNCRRVTGTGLTPCRKRCMKPVSISPGATLTMASLRTSTLRLCPSVPASRRADDQSRYQTPIEFQCQKNYAILLTDGEPTDDSTADSKIVSLPNFGELVGGDCDGNGRGQCLDDMAEYLYRADLSPLPVNRMSSPMPLVSDLMLQARPFWNEPRSAAAAGVRGI